MTKKTKEILFIIALAGGMLLLPAMFKQWWLFTVCFVFFSIFGIIEFIADKKTGHTVSQHFWEFSKKNKKGAIIVLLGMLISWLALLWHLAAKMGG